MKKTIYGIIIAGCGMLASQAAAQDLAVKPYGDVGLGNQISLSTTLPGMTAETSSEAFGADFGYTFWKKSSHSLEANIGVNFSTLANTFKLPQLSYNYSAPASADADGDPYQRYVELQGLSQNINLTYIKIPVYLQYQYRALPWLGVHAEAGVGFGFRCAASTGLTKGTAYSYGVYPQYDDLLIDADYLNDFGNTRLDDAAKGNPDTNCFYATAMAGAGVEIYVAGPFSIDLGVRYNAGLNDVYVGKYHNSSASSIDLESAPVTYEAARGQTVKAMSDYTAKSRLTGLFLHLGVNVRF